MKGRTARTLISLARAWQGLLSANPRGVLMISAVLLLLLTQTAVRQQAQPYRWVSNSLGALGILLFLLGFQSRSLPERIHRRLARIRTFFGITSTQLVYLLFSVFFSVIAATTNGFGAFQDSIWPTVVMWLISILLVLLGGWQSGSATLPSWRALLAAAGLGAAAFAARFVSVTTIPAYLTGDEASMGLSARAFIDGFANNIFSVGWFSFPSFFYFLESLSIRIFGNTALALRLPSALAGALTVSFVYLLGRALFGRLTGWLAAIFLVGFHFHVHFSRLGLNNVWDGLSIVIVLGAFWYGWHKDRRAYFLLAGFWLGLAQYFYVSSKITIVLIPLWAGIAFFLDREKLKKHIPDLVLLFLTAVIVVAPLAWFYYKNPSEFMAPIVRVRLSPEWVTMTAASKGLPEWRVIADQVWIGLKAFTHEPLRAWYEPGTPILRPAAAAFFLLGAALLLIRAKDMRTWLVFLLLLGFGMVSGLSFDPPAAQRYVAAAPWLALVVGFAASETASRLKGFWPEFAPAITAITIAFSAWLAFDDARFYFVDYTEKTNILTDNNAVAQHLADYLLARPEIEEIYFLGLPRMGYYSIQSTNFLVPDVTGVDINENWGSSLNPEISTDEPVFVLLPHKEEDLAAIMADFPNGSLLEARTRKGDLVFWVYDTTMQR